VRRRSAVRAGLLFVLKAPLAASGTVPKVFEGTLLGVSPPSATPRRVDSGCATQADADRIERCDGGRARTFVNRPDRRRVRRPIAALVALGAGASLALLHAGGAAAPVGAEVEEVAASVIATNPFATIERPAPGDERFGGRVVALRPAGPYTYASIDVGEGRNRWVVMLRAGDLATGDRVVVKSFGTQRAFRSRRLGMTFDELVFGVVRRAEEEREASR